MTQAAKFWSRVRVTSSSSCWLWQGPPVKDGYGRLQFDGKLMLAHRVAFILSGGKFPQKKPSTKHGWVVMHSCDTPLCCNPKHLICGSQADNITDRFRKGRDGNHKGEAHGRAKLTEKDVLAIRASVENGAYLAMQYNVTRTTICSIRHRKLWKHI